MLILRKEIEYIYKGETDNFNSLMAFTNRSWHATTIIDVFFDVLSVFFRCHGCRGNFHQPHGCRVPVWLLPILPAFS